jgi:hypothetical protein
MTDFWAARLSQAMDDDEAGEVTDVASGSDPGPGPWDAGPDAVADEAIAAAVLGYPTDADADAILASPGALERLTRRWTAVPPSAALIGRAGTNPALRHLLASAGFGRLNEAEPKATVPADLSDGTRPAQRLRSMQGSRFALAAADRAGVRHDEAWSGGRVIRQRLPDGSTAVTAEYTGSALVGGDAGDGLYVVSLSMPGETRTPLLLLILVRVLEAGDPSTASSPWAGQAVVGTAAALGELEIAGPIPVSTLTEAELEAVPDSVAWSRGPWNTAWRRVARAAGPASPLYEAVLRGTRQG